MNRTMHTFGQSVSRRGNTLILVTAILVLLVIIASAYISRVQGGRVGGASRQEQQKRSDTAQSVARDLALEISDALFPRPFATPGAANIAEDANAFRLPPPGDLPRHSAAPTDLAAGIRFNTGQYEVIPFTNWPDPTLFSLNFPGGANGNAILNALGLGEENTPGGPGVGDARWLASFEPIRWTRPGADNAFNTADDVKIFSHWRHMSNISRANNGYRIVRDISDVLNASGAGGIVTDLNLPVEQWLAMRSNSFNGTTGLPSIISGVDFFGRYNNWFNDYANAYFNPVLIPPNFLRLSDLNGDNVKFNFGDLPQDEFNRGSARWFVNRVLTDTDGDGFTDSFWFLAPESVDRGTRTIVAMRIVDNGGMANLNVATRFTPGDQPFGTDFRTMGLTPADLALVGELRQINSTDMLNPTVLMSNFNVGLFDMPTNWSHLPGPVVNYFSGANPSHMYWTRHTSGIGMSTLANFRPNQANRLAWFRHVGVAGTLTPTPGFGFAPYSLADELELRMYAGNNNPWSFSRFEQVTQLGTSAPGSNNFGWYLLRGNIEREESSEFLDQLDNYGLVGDMRRKLTMYNATRNDLMPAWLWPDGALANVRLRMKLDLRDPFGDFDRNGSVINDADREYLYEVVRKALVEDVVAQQSYYGDTSAGTASPELGRSNRMAGMLAANILSYRDEDLYAPLEDTIVVGRDGDVPANVPAGEIRAMGLERQPFLVEAFIGHVYAADYTALNIHPSSRTGPINPGDNVVTQESPQSTIVVVQIANPFHLDIPVNDPRARFELQVYGKSFDLAQIIAAPVPLQPVIPAATYTNPQTLTIVLMERLVDGDPNFPLEIPFRQFLGLNDPGVRYVNVEDFSTPPVWDTKRTIYDNGVNNPATMVPERDDGIQLVRVTTDPFGGGDKRVIIDRFNDPGTTNFGQGDNSPTFISAVARMRTERPLADRNAEPIAGLPWPEAIGTGADTHWIHWAHVTRAWGTSPDLDTRNPRFIFANRFVTRSDANGDAFSYNAAVDDVIGIDTSDPVAWPIAFNNGDWGTAGYPAKSFDGNQNGENLDFALQMNWKDDDIEHLGELLNIFTHGHLVLIGHGTGYERTLQTFSEFMQENLLSGSPDANVRVGRLDPFRPNSVISGRLGPTATLPANPPPAPPALPAAMRVLEAFACDGKAQQANSDDLAFRLAGGFTGRPVHGLINVNTAPVEVLRMMPHMARIIHQGGIPTAAGGFTVQPRVAVPEAIEQARGLYNGNAGLVVQNANTGIMSGPDYSDRASLIPGMRGGQGFASIGELLSLNQPATGTVVEFNQLTLKDKAWRIDFAAQQPFEDATTTPAIESAYISTDIIQPSSLNNLEGDSVASDAEEYNLLFSGMSNMITTRSDTFTVYFRVRSFRQNPTTGVWDATDREQIVDDSRYVMLIDRSEVNAPGQEPKILYLEKLPN